MSDKDLRNGLLSITGNCTRRDRIGCHESQPELRFRFKRLEEFIHKQTDLLFSICWRHFTTHLTGFISCLMETKLLGNVCWNDVNRWKAQSGGLWLNSTRHSTMTRINKTLTDAMQIHYVASVPLLLPCWRMDSKHDISWNIILNKWIKPSGYILHTPIYSVTFWKCWKKWYLFVFMLNY